MTRRTLFCADLFAGAGGFTSGLLRAAERLNLDVDLVAVNHWDIAVSTHSRNHPHVRHLCETATALCETATALCLEALR